MFSLSTPGAGGWAHHWSTMSKANTQSPGNGTEIATGGEEADEHSSIVDKLQGRQDEPGDRHSNEAISLDEVFEVLKNQRRRRVLDYLDGSTEPVTLSDLAEHIAGLENDKEPRLITSSERKRVYVGLYQSHLPKMDDAGAISYDKNRGIVEPGAEFDHFTGYLSRGPEPNAPSLSRAVRVLLAWCRTLWHRIGAGIGSLVPVEFPR